MKMNTILTVIATIGLSSTLSLHAASLPYPLNNLQTQYHNWLLQNTRQDGMIAGGYGAYTSEGIGFQVLLAAGMLSISTPSSASFQAAKTSLVSAYHFLYPTASTTRLNNGLLPWKWSYQNGRWTVANDGQYSATDADFYLAEGLYQAGMTLAHAEPTQASAYKKAATDMMHKIYQYDVIYSAAGLQPLFLYQGGANAEPGRNRIDQDGTAGIAYTKSLLGFMAYFEQADPQSTQHGGKDNWQTLITHTLTAMQATQHAALTQGSAFGGILGFIAQGVQGASWMQVANGKASQVDTQKTFTHWTFNYDAARVPLILGEYLGSYCHTNTTPDCHMAQTLLQAEMGGENQQGINGTFFNYHDHKMGQKHMTQGYYVYLPNGSASSGGTYADIFTAGQSVAAPSQDNNNAYIDDALNAFFLMGNVYADQDDWSKNTANPATLSALGLVNSPSGGYYGGAYKIMVGLILDGAYSGHAIASNPYVLANASPTLPVYNNNTRIALVKNKGGSNQYYDADYISPALIPASQAGKPFYVKITATPGTGPTHWTWATSAWDGTSVTIVPPTTPSCAILAITIPADKVGNMTIGQVAATGPNNNGWQSPADMPVFTYHEVNTSAPTPQC